ncbi:MAG: glycosyltransferase family 2 protein [Clostridia bacterium]|nr:glycosyltransferase family 2 protein [Clostridia bacterium]
MISFLLSFFGRGDVGIEPLEGLSGSSARFRWTVTSEEPLARLRLKHAISGWYMLETKFQLPSRLDRATFFFRNAEGEDVLPAAGLRLHTRRTSKRIVFLPFAPAEVLIQPCTNTGDLVIDRLGVTRITQRFALDRMLGKLGRLHPACKGKSGAQILDILAQRENSRGLSRIEMVHAAYTELFDESYTAPAQSYPLWIETIEKPSQPGTAEVSTYIDNHPDLPRFSIVIPVYNTPEATLRACLDSILAQSYPHWELCVADDASTAAHVRPLLEEYARRDTRIRVVFRPANGHISAASNAALETASGDFAVFVDHDDMLPEHALFHLAQAVRANPDARLFYSDEDKIDEQGARFDPHFKSDFNPDLLFAHNYISHLCAISRDLIGETGGFRTGVEGSQDYDLVLRCLDKLTPGQIVHIPRILYHWRAVMGSTALAEDEKGYTHRAGRKALADFMAGHPARPRVEDGPVPNSYRVRWPIASPAPMVSLIIPTRDKKELLAQCVSSILGHTDYANFEILILDNQSSQQETLDYFKALRKKHPSRVRVVGYPHPFNYSAMNNFGVRQASGDIIGLVNNDIEVISPGWLSEMVSHAVRPDIGCVGAKLYYPDDTLQHGGVICSLGGVAGHSHKYHPCDHPGYFNRLRLTQNLSAVTAACLLVRRPLFLELGGLDETNLTVAFNDVDFCLRVRERGLRNVWTPHAELFHHESVSRGFEDSPEKIERFRREIEYMKTRWGIALERDPYYNPNLTRAREDFSMEMVPEAHPLLQDNAAMYLRPFEFTRHQKD